MTPRPFQRLLAAAVSVLLLGLGSTASAQLLRYTGDGWAVAVTGPAPAIVTDHSGPDPWLAFEMLFDPAEEPIASSATSTTYAALSGWVQVNDHLLLLTDPTLEITREPTTPPSETNYRYIFRGVTLDGWIMRFSSISENPDLVPDFQLPTEKPGVGDEHRTDIELRAADNAWRVSTDRTLLFDVEEIPESAREQISVDTWEHVDIGLQDQAFTVTYRATPGANNIDAVTGLSSGPGDWWTDLGAIVRFAPSGFIDARNGGAYQIATTLGYQAGVRYTVSLSVDFATASYSASVTPEGGSAVLIADNYAFRTEQSGATSFDTLTFQSMNGPLAVSHVEVEGPPSGVLPTFTLIDLGTPTSEAEDLLPLINDLGTVVVTATIPGGNWDGVVDGGDEVHVLIEGGSYERVPPLSTDLPALRALALNNQDEIAGYAFDNEALQFTNGIVYDISSGVLRNLWEETNHTAGVLAFDLNDSGSVLGSQNLEPYTQAWVYDGNAVVQLDQVVPGDPESRYYFALNNAGQVLGYHDSSQNDPGAFVYTLATDDLQTLGQPGKDFTLLNDAGTAAGTTFDGTALVLHDGQSTRVIAGPAAYVRPLDLNNQGWIVGSFGPTPSPTNRAFLYDGETAFDLNLAVDDSGDWTLVSATDVNDLGEIVGIMRNSANDLHVFKLEPSVLVSDGEWVSRGITPQYGTFALTYTATPSAHDIDAVTGLSRNPANHYTNLAVIVRFAPSGRIDARNGGQYQAVTPFDYQADVNYLVRLEVDVWARRYSATVTAPGGSPVVIANNYAFRTEQSQANEFKAFNAYSVGGSLAVGQVAVETDGAGTLFSAGTWENLALPAHGDPVVVSYDVIPSRDDLDAVTGLSEGPADWFTDIAAIVRFAPSGRVDARNGGAYQAAGVLDYAAGVTYRVEIAADVGSGHYTATVTPDGGTPVVIADNYAFRSEQSGVSTLDTLTLFSSGGGATEVSHVQVD